MDLAAQALDESYKMQFKKIKLHKFFINCAITAATLSCAERKKVGAILTKDDRIISTGYNGQPSGFDNCCEIINADGTLKTKSTVIHAEMNAILFCAKTGISTNDTVLYITLSPCSNCVTSIIQAGIKEIFYLEKYRNTEGLSILQQAGVNLTQIDENGEKVS